MSDTSLFSGIKNLTLIEPTVGNYTAIGSQDANSIAGGDNNEYLDGSAGDDTVTGGGGNDTISGGAGSDSLDGGTGTNTLDYGYAGATGISIGLSVPSAGIYTAAISYPQGNSETDVFTNFQSINGSSGNDTIDFSRATTAFTINGLGGSNSIAGGSGNDLLIGGLGRSTFSGGLGNDTMRGSADGGDVADYGYVDPSVGLSVVINATTRVSSNGVTTYLTTVSAGQGDTDILENYIGVFGGRGADTFIGDNYVNILSGGLGNDSLDGKLGSDTVDYSYVGTGAASGLTTGLTLALNGTTRVNATVSSGLDVDTVVNIENVIGTKFDDIITGDNNANSIFGGAGNDIINGGIVNSSSNIDTLDGGDGIDTYNVAVTSSTITSAAVTVTLGEGATAGSILAQNNGTNFFTAVLYNFENVTTGSGADIIIGNSANNLLDSGGGADIINGGAGDDTLIGNTGNDMLDGGGQAGDTASYAYVTSNTGLSVTLASGTFAASVGGTDVDQLTNIENIIGTKNNDTIIGDANANTLDGANGNDLTDYSYLNTGTSGVSITLVNATTFNATEAIGVVDQLINFETLILTSYADSVNLSGASANLSINGGDGNDTIVTGAGNDTVIGGLGNNSLSGGGQAADLLSYAFINSTNNTTGITFALNGTNAVTVSGAQNDTIAGFENIIGSSLNDCIAGDSFANSIAGGSGIDTIAGGDGNDTLDGGGNGDWVDFSYLGSASTLTLNATNNTTWSADAGSSDQDQLTRFAAALLGGGTNIVNFSNLTSAVTIDGSNGQVDSIATGSSNDSIIGGRGADSLFGNGGNDTIRGRAGNDTIDGGLGNDFADFSEMTNGRTLVAQSQDTSGGFNSFLLKDGTDDVDTLINIEAIRLGEGNNFVDLRQLTSAAYGLTVDGSRGGTDSIYGGAGNDSFAGGAGADTLVGGLGNDTLDGGSGANDVADYSYLASGSSFNLTRANDTSWNATIGNEIDSVRNIEYLILGRGTNTVGLGALTSSTSVTVDGSLGASNSIATGAGADSLLGGVGADILSGGLGNDTMDGGGNLDTAADVASYAYINALAQTGGQGISVRLNGGGAQPIFVTVPVSAPLGTDIDTLYNIEGIVGTNYADTLWGDSTNNSFFGNFGNDSIIASLGSDTIDGGGNIDVVTYGALDSSNLYETISYDSVSFQYTVTKLNADGSLNSSDTLTNIESITGINLAVSGSTANIASTIYQNFAINLGLSGARGHDSILGGLGADTIFGNDGNDSLNGGSSLNGIVSANVLQGGAGNDTLDGGYQTVGNQAHHTADYSYLQAGSNLSIRLNNLIAGGVATAVVSGATSETDILYNLENFIGGAGNDTIIAEQAGSLNVFQSIFGGAGNDWINSGYGTDTLDGATGSIPTIPHSMLAGVSLIMSICPIKMLFWEMDPR